MAAQILDIVSDPAHAELAEVREVLTNLRGIEVEPGRQPLRRNGLNARYVELVQASQVHRESVRGEFGDLIGLLFSLVRPIHKPQCYHPVPCLQAAPPATRPAPRPGMA